MGIRKADDRRNLLLHSQQYEADPYKNKPDGHHSLLEVISKASQKAVTPLGHKEPNQGNGYVCETINKERGMKGTITIFMVAVLSAIFVASLGHSFKPIITKNPNTEEKHMIIDSKNFHGKCPICVKEGKKSYVYEGACVSTLMGTYSWYDEGGKYHYSDPNTTTCSYHCSEGHSFEVHGGGGLDISLPDGEWLDSEE